VGCSFWNVDAENVNAGEVAARLGDADSNAAMAGFYVSFWLSASFFLSLFVLLCVLACVFVVDGQRTRCEVFVVKKWTAPPPGCYPHVIYELNPAVPATPEAQEPVEQAKRVCWNMEQHRKKKRVQKHTCRIETPPPSLSLSLKGKTFHLTLTRGKSTV